MKKMILLIILFLVFNFSSGQSTLAAGDIAITGVNSAGTPEQFSFVLLTDVLNTTTITFTDNGWLNSGGFRTATAEGNVIWTATSDLSCGTEIIIENTGSNTYSATSGTAIEDPAQLGFALNTSGDEIIAFQGTYASPSFIYAVHLGNASGWTDATDSNNSAVPLGLTNGTTAMDLGDFGNGNYNCTTTFGALAILTDVVDNANWTLTNTGANRVTLGACTYNCGSCSGGIAIWNGITWSTTPNLTTEVALNANYDTATNGGSFSACNLTVSNNATLNIGDNDYIEVENNLTIDLDSRIIVQPYAAFVQNNNTGLVTNNGSISVDKITAPMDAWYEYTYWSSPVSGATVGGAIVDSEASRRFLFNGQNFLDATMETNNDNTPTSGQDNIDDNGNDWTRVNGTTVMQPGIGYATTLTKIAYDIAPGTMNKTFRFSFQGGFNNGIISVPVYRNDSELNDNNWNLIGNPYPSAIDADLFLAANSNVSTSVTNNNITIDGAIFLWSQDTAPSSVANGNEKLNFSNSDYAIINGTGETVGGDGTTPFITASGIRVIPSGQAFFVSMSNSAPATLVSGDVYTADIIFNNSFRVFGTDDNSVFFKNTKTKKSTNTGNNKLWLNLTSDNGIFNQTLIGYINGATDNDDGTYFDAKKNTSLSTSAILYSRIDGVNKKFAIQGKAINSINVDEVISLGFKTTIDVTTLYKLSIAQLQGDFLTGNTVYLKDNLLNTSHNLSDSDYTFTSEVGEFNERFEILFNSAVLSTEDINSNYNTLKIIELENNVVKFTASKAIKTIQIFDLLGRQLYQFKGNNTSEKYKLSNLNSSIYIAKVTLLNGTTITKKAFKK